MRAIAAARTPHGECDVDLCDRCQALWFDAFESAQLAPAAILALFREVARAPQATRRALPASMRCPRCRNTLASTRDLRHTTRFAYWRCLKGHGRLTPFVQFLREKDFIRPLSPAEVEQVKIHVRSVRCSGCGASVDLARDMACRYCGAALEVLDPDALAKTIAALDAASSRPPRIDLTGMADALLAKPWRTRVGTGERGAGDPFTATAAFDVDLVSRGIEFLGALMSPGDD